MWTWFRALFQPRAPILPLRIKWDAEGVSVEPKPASVTFSQSLLWRDTQLVIAYKKDCFSLDQIRLELYPPDGEGILITEDVENFAAFAADLQKHLPEIPADWHLKLIQTPAFDTAVHVLLKR